jgi:hypothetical protein
VRRASAEYPLRDKVLNQAKVNSNVNVELGVEQLKAREEASTPGFKLRAHQKRKLLVEKLPYRAPLMRSDDHLTKQRRHG